MRFLGFLKFGVFTFAAMFEVLAFGLEVAFGGCLMRAGNWRDTHVL